MRCPYCLKDTHVVDSRDVEEGRGIRRRRECLGCGRRFTTYERIDEQLVVIKRDGAREKFDSKKLLEGMLKACEKRPVEMATIERIAEGIERRLRRSGATEIKSTKIGSMVIKELLKLDKVAYLRFASVYKKFDSPKEFAEEVAVLDSKG
jgi:transcriptional repressor NrdR